MMTMPKMESADFSQLTAWYTSDELKTKCSHELRGIFTGKDMQALSAKATQLFLEGSIREGFDRNSYFAKSTSPSKPHTVKKSTLGKYACDKDCIGYRTRKICLN